MKTKTHILIRIIACFLLFAPLLVQGQENKYLVNKELQTPQEMHDMFMKKRSTNTIVGWVMVGSGAAMIVGGFAINLDYGWGEGNTNNGLWLSYVGGGVMLTSIPFFISAGSNKRKAKLALMGETVSYGFYGQTNNYSLSVSIPF